MSDNETDLDRYCIIDDFGNIL